jgi:hypothetical protein
MPTIDLVAVSTSGKKLSEVTGPLGVLEADASKLTPLVYPEDLGSSTKNHYVKFSIKQIVPSSPVTGSTTDPAKNALEKLKELNFKPNVTNSVGVICLYMPDTLTASYDASYDELSITNDLGRGITGLQGINSLLNSGGGNKQTGSATASDPAAAAGIAFGVGKLLDTLNLGNNTEGIVDAALSSQGFAINPQLQIIYRGIGFRKFQLNFLFTPNTQKEAIAINKIIATFKYHFAPELLTTTGAVSGMFFIPPSYFNVEFMFNYNENQFLPRYGDCVLTDINVDYAPNGFAAHNDGAPVQTQLTLSFQEIEIVTKAKIAAGYGADSSFATSTSSDTSAGLR